MVETLSIQKINLFLVYFSKKLAFLIVKGLVEWVVPILSLNEAKTVNVCRLIVKNNAKHMFTRHHN